MLRHAFEGLAHLHREQRLHQSLGPGSLVLSTVQERDAATLRARLRDLAFSVDVSDQALMGGTTISEMMAESRGDPDPSCAPFAACCRPVPSGSTERNCAYDPYSPARMQAARPAHARLCKQQTFVDCVCSVHQSSQTHARAPILSNDVLVHDILGQTTQPLRPVDVHIHTHTHSRSCLHTLSC